MIYPLFAMVLLTFIVTTVTLSARIKSVKSGRVSLSYYRLMQGQDLPDSVTKSSRHFGNLFEIPVLFYVVATLFVVLGIEDRLAVGIAWAFVAARCIHALIHLTYNNVLHRLYAFMAGNVCVLALWVYLLVRVSSQATA
ncbi:MAPEG family protein [Biformimicrobium ophioploci]|uniref:MAPEG family protein n=1 Tax=Biformimicrobium ophioploci TaxID=3036711 RepID=A0ABQ6LXT8_9GAMM|nr:MAPEG family protein [Microbulbifer sp. NKW57]GMG86924.1 MAPEG family protein [Microbulbifer sp. NKW57]